MTTAVLTKKRLSFKVQTLAAFAAIVGAVAVPQIFHAIGAVSGAGTALGETFLPMHLPIILAGLLAGPFAGAVAGALGPIASFAISGMPRAEMLVFMCVELCVYGLIAGMLRNVKMPVIAKVLIIQVCGRLARAAAVLIAIYAFGAENLAVASVWKAVTTGLPGILFQLCLIPLAMYRIDGLKKHEG